MSFFAEKLKSLRLAAGLTQKALADRVGIKQPSLAQLEVADHQPTWETVQKLARALGVSCEVFADVPDIKKDGAKKEEETPPQKALQEPKKKSSKTKKKD